MAHYFFDLRDGADLFPDEEGMLLNDIDAVQGEATRALGDMARDKLRSPRHGPVHQMAIEVRDNFGPVMHVCFSFEIARKN